MIFFFLNGIFFYLLKSCTWYYDLQFSFMKTLELLEKMNVLLVIDNMLNYNTIN